MILMRIQLESVSSNIFRLLGRNSWNPATGMGYSISASVPTDLVENDRG